MTLKQIEIFKTLSDKLNFTQTASALGMAQPAITNQIKALEAELNVKLFERMGKSVTLTHEGMALVPYANQMLSLKKDISGLFGHESISNSKSLVIGISDILSYLILPDILREFRLVCPNVQIKVVSTSDVLYGDAMASSITHNLQYNKKKTSSEEIQKRPISLLSSHEIDVALVMSAVDDITEPIVVHKKSRQNIYLLSAFTHNLAGNHMISGKDLSETQFLLPDKNCCYRLPFEQKLLSEGAVLNLAFESNSVEVLKKNAATGLGLCLLPEEAVKKELMTHSFEKVNFDTSLDVYSVLLTHKDKWISPELKKFLEIASQKLT